MEEKKNLATTYNPKEFEERIYGYQDKTMLQSQLKLKLKMNY